VKSEERTGLQICVMKESIVQRNKFRYMEF
jgi:hypothetical protein